MARYSLSISNYSSTGNVWIANYSSTVMTMPVIGKIDDVSIWNIALSSTAVTGVYNSGSGYDLSSNIGGALDGWWKMGDPAIWTGTADLSSAVTFRAEPEVDLKISYRIEDGSGDNLMTLYGGTTLTNTSAHSSSSKAVLFDGSDFTYGAVNEKYISIT